MLREIGDVNKDGVAISREVYFQRNRIGLRLQTTAGDVIVAALHQEAVDRLLNQLQELRDV